MAKKQTVKKQSLLEKFKPLLKKYGIGTAIILFATLLYFAPLLNKLHSYSEGGDSMFNAWTLARNHNCLKGACDKYIDGNIYYPNKDTMLYSETQLSTGLLTLPLHYINDNPIFSYNVWKIFSTFLSGWFMYLLVKKISKGHELVSVMSGLIFAFAPFKMSALGLLLILSIFYLPLIVLFILCYLENQRRRYIVGLLISLLLLFYASWYQMFFVLGALGAMLLAVGTLKLAPWRTIFILGSVVVIAVISTLPLAKQYTRFSKENDSGFTIGAQPSYASSVADYFIPHGGTAEGKLYDAIAPASARRNSYNLDSTSYHGVLLYVLALALLIILFRKRKTNKENDQTYRWALVWLAVGFIGLLFSLGPLLKISGDYIYATLDSGVGLSVPLPYILLDFAMPQIQFIRAVGRWSVLFLFALCVALAYLPNVVENSSRLKKWKKPIYGLVIGLLIFELAPIHLHYMSGTTHAYNIQIPGVYTYIKDSSEVDNLLVLYADQDYPNPELAFARMETVLWAGYHNKNIFNGYSGYTPPNYEQDYADFRDLRPDDVDKMKAKKLGYVLIDKQLSTTNPELANTAKKLFGQTMYEDSRYVLLKIAK